MVLSGVEIVFSWIWKNFQADIVNFSAEHLKKLWQGFTFRHAAENYENEIKQEYNRVHLWNMTTPITLRQIYTHVNVLDTPHVFRQTPKERVEHEVLIDFKFGNILEKGADGLKVARENKRLFILGKPGAGKTTFLKYITLESIEGDLKCLPIFVTLRDFAGSGKSLFDFIVDEFRICGFPDAKPFVKTLLQNGESFELTNSVYEKLVEKELPSALIEDLKTFENKEYTTEKDFLNDLEEVVGMGQYTPLIISYAKRKVFQLTDSSFSKLNGEYVPNGILKQIESVKNKRYAEENAFVDAIKQKLSNWLLLICSKYARKEMFRLIEQSRFELLKYGVELHEIENNLYETEDEVISDIKSVLRQDSLPDKMLDAITGHVQRKNFYILTDRFFSQLEQVIKDSSFGSESIAGIEGELKQAFETKESILSASEELLARKHVKITNKRKFFQFNVQEKSFFVLSHRELKKFRKIHRTEIKENQYFRECVNEFDKFAGKTFDARNELLEEISLNIRGDDEIELNVLRSVKPYIERAAVYVLTEASLERLKDEKVPVDILHKIRPMIDKQCDTEEDFLNYLQKTVGEQWYENIILTILNYAKEEYYQIDSKILKQLKSKKVPKTLLGKVKELCDTEYRTERELEVILQEKIGTERYISHILQYARKPKTIVLCDGLDEVLKEDGTRHKVIQELRNFSREYRASQMIITCRIAASEYFFESFTYVEMADFTKEQVSHFVNLWFAAHKSDIVEKLGIGNRKNAAQKLNFASRFLYEYEQSNNQRLSELSKNPLLLMLLCIAFEESLTFPVRRSEIYEQALDVMLRKWDVSRGIRRDEIHKHLTLGRKRQMLARIGAETFTNDELVFSQKKLVKMITTYMKALPKADHGGDVDGDTVIKAVQAQHGVLIERSQGMFSFSHLTFQEYFTTKYILENARRGALEKLVTQYFFEDRWREVILLTVEMLDEADDFLYLCIEQLEDFIHKHNQLRPIIDTMKKATRLSKRNMREAISSLKLYRNEYQEPFFEHFVSAIGLFFECTEVACISNRQDIMNALYQIF